MECVASAAEDAPPLSFITDERRILARWARAARGASAAEGVSAQGSRSVRRGHGQPRPGSLACPSLAAQQRLGSSEAECALPLGVSRTQVAFGEEG